MLLKKRMMDRGGFALFDVLIGVTILSIALAGIAFAWRQSTVTTVSARNYNQATYYAQQALEKLKTYDGKTSGTWTTSTAISQSGTMPAFTITTAQLASGDAPEYDALSAATRAKLVPVRATVTWQEPVASGNNTHTIEIIGYYYLK